MSMIIAKRIDEKGFIDIQNLKTKYASFCIQGANLLIFINRIFNEEYKVVKTPKITIEAPIVEFAKYFVKVNLFDIMAKYGIPKDYYVEIIVSNIILKYKENTTMIPVFYNEIKLDCDSGIEKLIKEEVESLQKTVEAYEIIGKLHHIKLIAISDDLREAIIRLDKRDVDGSIKFFRKVIEGFEHLVNESILKSPNRVEQFKSYLKKAFHLLSNFGEHAGTNALLNEAVFSKEITLSMAKYIVAKMEE